MHFVHILYSSSIDRYYVGETDEIFKRLEKHNNGHYKAAFTSQADDWEIQLKIEYSGRPQALAIEKSIKKRKSRQYVESLIQYPELVQKLVSKH